MIFSIFLFSTLQIWAVFSASNVLKLESVSVVSKSDILEEGPTDISGNTILRDSVKFHKVGDSITYSVKIKNNGRKNYTLKSVTNDNKNEYISYSYGKYSTVRLEPGKTFDFIFTETYSQEVEDISKREQKFSVNFNFTLEDEKGNIFEEIFKLNNNPIFGDDIGFYTILSLIPIACAVIIFKKLFMRKTSKIRKNKNTKLKFFILFSVVCFALLPQISKSLGKQGSEIILANNIELKDKLLVSYDIDGIVDEVIVPYGTKLSIDEPYKECYSFKGWQTEDGNLFDKESEIKDDIYLKAIFEADVYNITYNLNGGEANNPSTYTIEDEVIINDPVKPGYTFDGWTGTNLTELTKDLVIYRGSSGDRTYSANWTPNEYTIIFDPNGGTGNMDPKVMTYGVSENLPPNKFKKGSEAFLGWNTQKDGSGKSYADAAPVKNLSENEYITLYAQWSDDWAMFLKGQQVNVKMKNLAGNNGASASTINNNIVSVLYSSSTPPQNAAVVSTTDSPKKIYMWYENNIIYYFSEAKHIYLNPDSNQMFAYFNVLKNIDASYFLTDKVTNMSGIFGQCKSLQSLDLRSFNTFQVKNMGSMFNQCNSLKSVDVSSFNTNNVTDMNRMFTACTSLESLNLSSFRTGNVDNMEKMFDNLPLMKSIDVSKFDTSKVKKMNGMFRNCPALTVLNLRNFSTSAVTTMDEMFSGCLRLTSILINPSKFQTGNVKSMKQMFYMCNSLKSFDFTGFNTKSVTDMSSMFTHCSSIASLNLSSFNTSSVKTMNSMFNQCNSLITLNISSFNTSSAEDMDHMFSSCHSIKELNISSFNTGNVVDMEKMFDNMFSLTTIYASENFTVEKVTKGSNMFINDTNLVGGNNTVYDQSHVDVSYARIGSSSAPGYFKKRS